MTGRILLPVVALACVFSIRAEQPLKVEGCFDPKGGHIQGMCRGGGFTYLTQMTGICKIDGAGKCVARIPALSHTGDVCWHDGRIYSSVSVYVGPDKGKGKIQVFDADLRLLKEHTYARGLDGIAWLDGRLYVGQGSHLETVPHAAGAKPESKTPHLENDMLIVDPETLEVVEKRTYSHGGKTRYGAQNITTDGKLLYVTFYPGEKGAPDLVAYDRDLKPGWKAVAGAGTGIEFVGFENGKPRFLKSKTIKGKGTISAEILAANPREVR